MGMLSHISEIGSENLGPGSLEEGKLGNSNDGRFYGTGFPLGSWSDSSNFTESLGGLRRDLDDDRKLFSISSTQVAMNSLFG